VLRRIRPFWILAAAWLALILYAFPGYMNWDCDQQLLQLRAGLLSDWHPPVMATYWRWLEVVVAGPTGMLLVQATLFLWGLYRILRRRLEPRLAAWLAAGLLLFPPILTPMAPVWKDAQMVAFLVAGLALALDDGWPRRALGVALLVLAAAVRDNAPMALPPLCLLIVATWAPRRWWIVVGLAALLTVGITGVAGVANAVNTDEHDYAWYKTVAIFDIAGTICDSDMTDAEIQRALAGSGLYPEPVTRARICKVYSPRVWFKLSFGGADSVFLPVPKDDLLLHRRAVWLDLIRAHPGAFLHHRWDAFRETLGLSDSELWEPVCQSFGITEDQIERMSHRASLSGLQETLGDAFRDLAETPLFRPWIYAACSTSSATSSPAPPPTIATRTGW